MNTKFKIATAVLSASLIITPSSGLVQNNQNVAKAEKIENEVSKMELNRLRSELHRHITDESIVDNLIYKFQNNIPWDNISGKEPIEREYTRKDNIIINKQVFEDGSFIVKEIDLENAENIRKTSSVQFRSISGGSYSGGADWYAYKGVSVSSYYGTFNYGFTADYECYSNGYGKITNVYSPWQWGVGTFSNQNLYIGEAYGDPAYATYSLDYSAPGGWFSKSIKVTLYVNGSSAWDDDN